MKTEILTKSQINQKIERIAFQIYENAFDENQLFIGGIDGNGFEFAERLAKQLKSIATTDFKDGIHLFKIKVNKDKPLSEAITLNIADNKLKNSSIIIADDVINSGRTMIHAVGRILNNPIKSIKTAVLVNRTHRRFPIHANFEGMAISTTLQDSIIVEFGEKECAYLV
ncbi:MAG: phosphoribosyltransferase family protein [Crocinitomicaceae bacterium]